jgi:hypothetical protein
MLRTILAGGLEGLKTAESMSIVTTCPAVPANE